MHVTAKIELQHRRAEKRPCTLLTECVIQLGRVADYRPLAAYHYRSTKTPPGVHDVYIARHVPTDRVVGAIVYGAPSLNLSARNRVFGDYFNSPVKQFACDRVNREVELIMRVVVHPTFRGTGLGHRLVGETLRRRPYRVIEMSAAMGNMNPFAEKAGMTGYTTPRSAASSRVLSALRSVGMTEGDIANPAAILKRLEQLPPTVRAYVEGELHRFERWWITSRTSTKRATVSIEQAAARVAGNCLLSPMYYVWINERRETDSPESRSPCAQTPDA